MKIKLAIALFLGFFTIGLISYSYSHQRQYSQNYKTVITGFHELQNSYNALSYEILESALYSYSNQDIIAHGIEQLNQAYADLYNAPLMHNSQYLSLEYPLITLGTNITTYNADIEYYLMLNAGIKNSFVFLLNYTERANKLFTPSSSIYLDINTIVSELSNMRRLLDQKHLSTVTLHLNNIKAYQTDDPLKQAYLETVVLHVTFIQNNFSKYTTLISTLQSKHISTEIRELQDHFNAIANTDFILLDTIATILLVLVITALITIILLLLHAQRENRNLKRLKNKLEHLVNYDRLTGLLNRNNYNQTMLQKKYRHPTFLLININGFKHINDLYGTDIGDYILQEVSQLIKLPIFEPYTPSYYHLGGDDFGILLESITQKQVLGCAEVLAQSIKHFIFIDNDVEISITVSIAINTQPPLLENADMVLKHYKKQTPESIVFFSEELALKKQIENNINTLQNLAYAIEEKRIVPFFQPIIELNSGHIVKYEALVRQQNSDGSITGPDSFIKLAGQTPLYRELTKTMIEQVFIHFKDQPYRFSINLSMQDLLDSELMHILETLLEQNPQSAHRLEIELLESENLFDIQATEHFITLLKSYGCHIAIDDFGTGYSNFSYLARLSVDTLKIDGSLITKILTDDKYLKTVEAIVHYANTLGVETVAEFVETQEIALKLREIGVTYGQGYYFSKPQPKLIKNSIFTF